MFEDGCKVMRPGLLFGKERFPGEIVTREEMGPVGATVLSALQNQGHIEDPAAEAASEDIRTLAGQIGEVFEVLQSMTLQMAEVNKRLGALEPIKAKPKTAPKPKTKKRAKAAGRKGAKNGGIAK